MLRPLSNKTGKPSLYKGHFVYYYNKIRERTLYRTNFKKEKENIRRILKEKKIKFEFKEHNSKEKQNGSS